MNLLRGITFFCSLVFAAAVSATEHHVFRRLEIANGMSNNNVKTILKDKKGFLWVGTASGLNRYDGYGFRQYGLMSSTESIDDYLSDIWSLQEDYDGNIWVRGYKYYSVFNRDKDAFSVEVPKLLAGYGIEVTDNYCVYVDRSRNLWVLTDNTIHFFDMSARKLKSIPHSIGTLYSNIGISDDSAGLYILMETGEIYTIDKSRLTIGHTDGPEGINSANHIYADYQHGLWLFSDHNDDIFYRKQSSRWVRLPLPSSSLTQSKGVCSILDDKSGHVLIGTDHNGLFIYSQSSGELESFVHDSMTPGTLPSNNVSYIYQDSDNTIWFGHNKSGISYYNNDLLQFENFSLCRGLDVASLLTDSRNNLWIGTDGNGLLILRPGSETIERMPAVFNGSIICLEEDSDGRIWVGSYGNGLYCIDGNNVRHFTTANSSLISDIIWALQNDEAGNIWIATLKGTQYVSGKTDNFISVLTAKGEQINSMCLHSDKGDTVYIGSFDGLYKVDTATKKQAHTSQTAAIPKA